MQKSYDGGTIFLFCDVKSDSLEGFSEAAVTTMLATLQILPLRADSLVVLHLWHGLSIAEAIALELLYQVVEDEGVGTLLAIFGQHTY